MSTPRKRQKADAGHAVNVSVAQHQQGQLEPVLALFPSAKPSARTPFTLYAQSGDGSAGPATLAAQTEEIEYDSRNQLGKGLGGDMVGEGVGHSVEYMLGVHDPRTGSLTLHATPLHTLSTSLKSLKSIPGALSTAQITAQRYALGSTFGTKRAIRSIKAQERNKLDLGSMGDGRSIQSLLQSSITFSSSSLPTTEAVEKVANVSRPIPPPNFDATEPNDVYDMDTVVSDLELDAFELGPLLEAGTVKERNAFLPFRRSNFITNRLKQLLPKTEGSNASVPSKKDRYKIKLLVHLSFLFAFRQAAPAGRDSALERVKLSEKLGAPSDVVMDRLLERYTEVQRGESGEERRKMTSGTELKLLSYLLVVVLKLDGWGTDVGTIAADLNIGSKRVSEMFRGLGCTLVTPNAGEMERLVQLGSAPNLKEAKKAKRAVLKVPLEFPKERRAIASR